MEISGQQYYMTPEHARAAKTAVSEEERLREACEGFEAIFLHKMLQSMRSATMDSDLVKKSNGEKIFVDMLDQELSDVVSKGSVNGLADMLYQQLSLSLFPSVSEEGEVSDDATVNNVAGEGKASKESDSLTTRHTIAFNDNDIEMQRLKLNSVRLDSVVNFSSKRKFTGFDIERMQSLGTLNTLNNVNNIINSGADKSLEMESVSEMAGSASINGDRAIGSRVSPRELLPNDIFTGEEFINRF